MFISTAIAAESAATEVVKGEAGAFPPFDPTYMVSQLFWLAVTFGALYFVMSRMALPRIGGILEDRSMRIAQDLDETARLKQETDELIATYEQELADARHQAYKIGQTSKDEASKEAAFKRKDAEAALERKIVEAETRIAAVKSKALAKVDGIAQDTTQTIIQELLGGAVSATEIKAALK